MLSRKNFSPPSGVSLKKGPEKSLPEFTATQFSPCSVFADVVRYMGSTPRIVPLTNQPRELRAPLLDEEG